MPSFYQKKCPYCGNEFTEQDDVVVCPECGTPHHRACWLEHGVCANTATHGQPAPETASETTSTENEVPGNTASSAVESEETPGAKLCPRCGYRNRPDAAFCSGCGLAFQVQSADSYRTATYGFDPTIYDPSLNFSGGSDYEDVPAADMARMVGKNTAYYLPVFARIRANGRSRFNFFALLFGGAWMLFRKQYKRGSIVLLLQLLLQGLQLFVMYGLYLPKYMDLLESVGVDLTLSTQITEEQMGALIRQIAQLGGADLLILILPLMMSAVILIFSIFIGCKANKWYYRDTLSATRKLRQEFSGNEEELAQIETQRGGVNMPLGLCLALCGMILYYASDYIGMLFLP